MELEQMHLVCYLESLGCEEVRVSPSGYYVMRNPKNLKLSGVPVASSKTRFLKKETIANICNALDVPSPFKSDKPINEVMAGILEDVKAKIKNGSF